MADAATPLSPLDIEPLIDELEVVTAVVDLAVGAAHKLPALEDRGELGAAVAHPRQCSREMDGGIRVASNPEHQDFSIDLVGAADRAVQAVRHVQRMIGSDAGRVRSDGRKSVRAVTAQYI